MDVPPGRLAREFQRLYLPTDAPLSTDGGPVRALIFEVARPAAWAPLAAVWRGVQDELDLPPPAIAVNGQDGLQLWFSLAQGVGAVQGQALLEGLRKRYMADVPLHRVSLRAGTAPPWLPRQVQDQTWSAFVAADLAPLFEEAPWLDSPPNVEGQAELLSRAACVSGAAFQAALRQLQGAQTAGLEAPAPAQSDAAPARDIPAAPAQAPRSPDGTPPQQAAQQFLLQVMHDPQAPLALRVEAARALLTGAPPG